MRLLIIIVLASTACTRPAPQAPQSLALKPNLAATHPELTTASSAAPDRAEPAPTNRAELFTAKFVPKLDPSAKCELWSGRGTAIPGSDAVLCQGQTLILWCTAPDDGKPGCSTSVDWGPQQAPPTAEAAKSPAPAKGKGK